MSQIQTKFIADHAVTNVKFRQSAALALVGNASNATADVADIVAASDFQIMRRSGTAIGFGSIDLSQSAAVGASILAIANGGTGQASASAAFGALSPLTTKGDLLGFSTLNARVPVGTDGFVLTADSGAALGVSWQAATTGANTSLSNLITTSINQSLIPDSDLSHDLGAVGLSWANGFIGQLMDGAGVLAVDITNRTLSDSAGSGAVNFATPGSVSVMANLSIMPTGGVANAALFYDDAADFAAHVKAPSVLVADTLFQLPPDNGTAGFVLQTDGAGVTSWVASSGSSSTPAKETFVLSGTDITNQFIDLANVALTDSILFAVKGAGSLLEGALYDYSVSYTGGAGGNTRITFLNDLATGGGAALIAGDVVQVNYAI